MPEKPHHAFEIHMSFPDDFAATWTREILTYLEKETVYHALKHETGETGHLHAHIALVYELATAKTNGGAKTASNMLRHLLLRCPGLQLYLSENRSRFSIVKAPLKSDEFVAEYLQKEGDLRYFNLPRDLAELRPYFADMQRQKNLNPEFTKWCNMYMEDQRPLPASDHTVHQFVYESMFETNRMKILPQRIKRRERVECLVQFINKESVLPPPPTRNDPQCPIPLYARTRICPRCDRVPLEPRHQFCDDCVEYRR